MSQIREYAKNDENRIIDIWVKSNALAHPFLPPEFVSKVKKDMREIYLPNTKSWVYEEKGTIVGFISMIENEIGTQLVDFVSIYHEDLEVEVFEKNNIGRKFYAKYGFLFMKEYFHEESKNTILRLKYTVNQ